MDQRNHYLCTYSRSRYYVFIFLSVPPSVHMITFECVDGYRSNLAGVGKGWPCRSAWLNFGVDPWHWVRSHTYNVQDGVSGVFCRIQLKLFFLMYWFAHYCYNFAVQVKMLWRLKQKLIVIWLSVHMMISQAPVGFPLTLPFRRSIVYSITLQYVLICHRALS